MGYAALDFCTTQDWGCSSPEPEFADGQDPEEAFPAHEHFGEVIFIYIYIKDCVGQLHLFVYMSNVYMGTFIYIYTFLYLCVYML